MLKAQASIEFLFTYGWAVLAIAVSIGALTYFNLANPDTFVQQRCELSSQIQCVEYAVYDNNTVHLKLRSDFQTSINITEVTVKYLNVQENTSNSFILRPRRVEDVFIDLPVNAVEKATASINLAFYFQANQSSNTYRVSGTIHSPISPS